MWFYATTDTLRELKKCPTKDVQVLEHLSYVDIPTDVSQVDKVLNLGNLVWKLNGCLQKSCQTINRMKKEHMNYMVMRQLYPNNQSKMNLATLVQNDIQWPVKGRDYGIILPQQIDDCDLDSTIILANQRSVNL
ncbi:unnamed protein product [Rhizopus microsporus]